MKTNILFWEVGSLAVSKLGGRQAGMALATLCLLWACCWLPQDVKAQDPSEVIFQGFYWNTNPGDMTTDAGGIWWDTLSTVASELAGAGFHTVWTPPASKGFAGRFDMGYGVADYYDFGEFNQYGTTRTRHGTRAQLENAISALHANGLQVMADVVLNHRGGAPGEQLEDCNDGDGQQLRFTDFGNPASGRLPMDSADFHPNFTHCDLFSPYHDRVFFEDLCHFNLLDQTLNPGAPDNGWYFGPHNIGRAGDSLIVFGRYLLDELGFDAVRLDAVKHVEPGFMAPFLVELANGNQPFAVGELFDGNLGTLKSYNQQVENFVSTFGTGSKDASLAIFDFNLRFALRDMANGNGAFDMWSLNSAGLKFNPSGGLDGDDIVTFVENHDFDRIGYVQVPCPGGVLQVGNTCLDLSVDSGHDPVITDKHMAYAYIMAAEGRPSVFWKDWFWFDLEDDIRWQMAMRKAMAAGGAIPIQSLNPFFVSGNGGDLFIMNRFGTGNNDGLVFAINDGFSEAAAFVNTPFSNTELKDYSDAYLFFQTAAFGDSRAFIKANGRNYAWYAPTGLYPQPPEEAPSAFTLGNHVGAKLGFVVLRASDASSLMVNGAPIAAGDQVAITPVGNTTAVGLGRIGQSFAWDGTHDMIIEVLGGGNATEARGGLQNGQSFDLWVYDASAGESVKAGQLTFAPSGTDFLFSADRPGSRGGSAPFSLTTNHTGNSYSVGGISLVTGFEAGCSIAGISAGLQSACNPLDNTYTQEITVSFAPPAGATQLIVNGQSFALGTSPQTVTLDELLSDGQQVDVNVSFDAGICTAAEIGLFTAPVDCEPPVIDCPADQIIALDPNCQATLPDYTGLAVVSDNFDASPTISQSPPAGTLLTNTTGLTVTLTATDNEGNSADCSYSVIPDEGPDSDGDGTGDNCDDCPLALPGLDNFSEPDCGCEPGYFATVNAQGVITSCQPCPAGTFNPVTGATECQPCLAGTYSDVTGATECKQCELGTANDTEGATQCTPCQPGFFADAEGQANCSECPAGRFSNTSGATECQNCPTGTFNPETGQSSCQDCPAGTYNPDEGQIACLDCEAGEDSDPGATVCTPVDAGTATIITEVWDDFGNGLFNPPGEPLLENITVNLLDASSNVVATAVTGPDGRATFSNLLSGDYVVEVVPPTDFGISDDNGPNPGKRTDIDPNTGLSPVISLPAGGSEKVEAALWSPGVTVARLWEDNNGNGIRNPNNSPTSDEYLFGMEVELLEENGDPLIDPNTGLAVAGIIPCGDGGLALYTPADRPVKLRYIANGATFTSQWPTIGNPNRSHADPVTGETGTFSLDRGNDVFGGAPAGVTDLGNQILDATINTFVWDDRNADGTHQGEGAFGIEGVKVSLTDLAGNACICAFTDDDGKATLGAPSDGNFYRLEYRLKEDHAFTSSPGTLTDDKNNDAKLNTAEGRATAKFNLSAGQTINYIEAGMFAPGTLNTFVFDDRNADGTHQGEGAFGIEGVDVQLVEQDGSTPVTYPDWWAGPGNPGDPVATVTTGTDGKASIDYIPADRFVRLVYSLKDDHKFVVGSGAVTNDKNSDLYNGSGETRKFKIEKGSEVINYVEAGMIAPGTLNTFVFDDRNADGTHQGEGAFGIEGVDVQLVEQDGSTPVTYPDWWAGPGNPGDPVATVTTGTDGKASIDYIPADRFVRLLYSLPADHKFVVGSGAVTNDKNSDLYNGSGETRKFKIEKGSETINYVEAGMWAPGVINTFVWHDINADGSHQGEGSLGVAGVTVTLYEQDQTTVVTDNNGNPVTAVTDAGGNATLSYVPANRQLRVGYSPCPGGVFTTYSSPLTGNKNSDVKFPNNNGTTVKFSVDRGSQVINYIEAGLTAVGSCCPDVNSGFSASATIKGGVRWRDFRTSNDGNWEVAVGNDIGSVGGPYSTTNFANQWNLGSPNAVTFEYDPNAGTLTATTTHSGGTSVTTHNVGNLGTVDYLQWFLRGDGVNPNSPATDQTVSFKNVELTVNGTTCALGDFVVIETGATRFINYDLSGGFTLSGDLEFNRVARNAEGGKLEISIGEESPVPTLIAEDDLLPDALNAAEEAEVDVREESDNATFARPVTEPSLLLYPVPVRTNLTVALTFQQEERVNYRILNAAGQTVREDWWPVTRGENQMTLPVYDLPAGTYFYILRAQDGTLLSRPFTKM